MIILDTNVLSEPMRQRPDHLVMASLDRQAELAVWTTSINIFELRGGIEMLPDSRRRSRLETEFERLIDEDFHRRVVAFDTAAAEQAARLMAARQRAGRPGGPPRHDDRRYRVGQPRHAGYTQHAAFCRSLGAGGEPVGRVSDFVGSTFETPRHDGGWGCGRRALVPAMSRSRTIVEELWP